MSFLGRDEKSRPDLSPHIGKVALFGFGIYGDVIGRKVLVRASIGDVLACAQNMTVVVKGCLVRLDSHVLIRDDYIPERIGNVVMSALRICRDLHYLALLCPEKQD